MNCIYLPRVYFWSVTRQQKVLLKINGEVTLRIVVLQHWRCFHCSVAILAGLVLCACRFDIQYVFTLSNVDCSKVDRRKVVTKKPSTETVFTQHRVTSPLSTTSTSTSTVSRSSTVKNTLVALALSLPISFFVCLSVYIHTYIDTCTHAHMHTCIHAYMHTCIHTYIRV